MVKKQIKQSSNPISSNKNQPLPSSPSPSLSPSNISLQPSKKQKRRLQKLKKRQQQKTFKKTSKPIHSIDQQEQKIELQQSNDVEIISQQIESGFGGIQLNDNGQQGFQELVNLTCQNEVSIIKVVKFQVIDKVSGNLQKYLYRVKRKLFYKVTSLGHEKVNLTHLNEVAQLQIVDQNKIFPSIEGQDNYFYVNGQILKSTKILTFIKSTVFQLIQNSEKIHSDVKNTKKNIKDSKNKSKKNEKENVSENISSIFQPFSDEDKNNLMEFIQDTQFSEECLLVSKEQLNFQEATPPFADLDEKILKNNNSLLILGKKNTGKSTLSEYIKNINPQSVCILDCDIGRSLTISGCVSLITPIEKINIWIGQFTPFNCVNIYIKAIEQLYKIYREKYFSNKLIINTMGYLSGLGQMIIYEIYHLINPSEIIVIDSKENSIENLQEGNLPNIIANIKTGNYLQKLITTTQLINTPTTNLRKFNQKKSTLSVYNMINVHAQGKGIPIRFQSLLCPKKNIKNILQLLKLIKKRQLQKLQVTAMYRQDRSGSIEIISQSSDFPTISISNMRIVLLGKQMPNQQNPFQKQVRKLYQIYGIGYGYEGSIYYFKNQVQKYLSDKQRGQFIGILNEGVDFQKNFYLLNQVNLIEFELEYGNIPYILPIIKGIGSKGIRNNPSKNI